MPGRLQDRIALITGSSSGIGRAIALGYAKEGAIVVCSDLQEGTVRANAPSHESNLPTHALINQSGGRASFVHIDVTSSSSVSSAISALVAQHGRLDIMVNNAGVALEPAQRPPDGEPRWSVWNMPDSMLSRTLDVNVTGVFNGVKHASAQMISQSLHPDTGSRGHIINTCSIYGLVATAGAAAYCTSKGAVANLTRAAALDCAPHRVHVNAVNPGFIQSNLTDAAFANAPGVRPYLDAMHPLGGVGNPEDVVQAFIFLATKDAKWMTGVNMPVDGGYTAQ